MIDIEDVTLNAIANAGGHKTALDDIAQTKRLLERIKELEVERTELLAFIKYNEPCQPCHDLEFCAEDCERKTAWYQALRERT